MKYSNQELVIGSAELNAVNELVKFRSEVRDRCGQYDRPPFTVAAAFQRYPDLLTENKIGLTQCVDEEKEALCSGVSLLFSGFSELEGRVEYFTAVGTNDRPAWKTEHFQAAVDALGLPQLTDAADLKKCIHQVTPIVPQSSRVLTRINDESIELVRATTLGAGSRQVVVKSEYENSSELIHAFKLKVAKKLAANDEQVQSIMGEMAGSFDGNEGFHDAMTESEMKAYIHQNRHYLTLFAQCSDDVMNERLYSYNAVRGKLKKGKESKCEDDAPLATDLTLQDEFYEEFRGTFSDLPQGRCPQTFFYLETAGSGSYTKVYLCEMPLPQLQSLIAVFNSRASSLRLHVLQSHFSTQLLNDVAIGSSVTAISSDAFLGRDSLTKKFFKPERSAYKDWHTTPQIKDYFEDAFGPIEIVSMNDMIGLYNPKERKRKVTLKVLEPAPVTGSLFQSLCQFAVDNPLASAAGCVLISMMIASIPSVLNKAVDYTASQFGYSM